MAGKFVNKGVTVLAERAGVTKALVSRKLRQGKSPEEIIAEAQIRRAKREAGKAQISTSEAQRRKEIAIAGLRELELKERRGELVETKEVANLWAVVFQTVRDQVMAVADRCSAQLAAMTDQRMVRDRLSAELNQALTNLPAKLDYSVKKSKEVA